MNEQQNPTRAAQRYFAECFGEGNKRVMQFLGGQRGSVVECHEMPCADGEKRNLIDLSLRELVDIALHRRSSDLTVTFFLQTGDELPAAVTLVFEDEFDRLMGLPTDTLVETLDQGLIRHLTDTLKFVRQTPKLNSPGPIKRGVPPMNAHKYRPQRPEARTLDIAHSTSCRR